MSAVLKSPEVLETVNKTVRDNREKSELGGSAGFVLREGSFKRIAESAQRVADENHVKYSQKDLAICKGGGDGGGPITSGPCTRVQITAPEGAPEMGDAKRYNVSTRFPVRWLPNNCAGTVELVSPAGHASGAEADAPTRGPLQVRVVSAAPDGGRLKVLGQVWVNVVPPEPPPPPPPPVPDAEAGFSTSKPDVFAKLESKSGTIQLQSGGPIKVRPGDYTLVWSNSSRSTPVTMKPGATFWAHQEALPPPPRVELVPPATPHANLTEGGAALTGPQRRDLSGPGVKLKLSLLDDQQDVAEVEVAPAPEGGVELKVEPVARKASYAPAWIGGGAAAVASLLWAVWLRPAASSAQDEYDHLVAGDDFAAGRDRVMTTAMRANVALGIALTSLVVGGVVQGWDLYRSAR